MTIRDIKNINYLFLNDETVELSDSFCCYNQFLNKNKCQFKSQHETNVWCKFLTFKDFDKYMVLWSEWYFEQI